VPAPKRRNLIEPTDPLVGRRGDLQQVVGALHGELRVLTITGPAGIGKSRLAIEVARAEHAASGSGAWICEVSDATQPAGLCDALAAVLDMADSASGKTSAIDRVGKALSARGEALIVLDNFDALVRIAPDTVGRLLELAPEARIVVTTRERLKLPGEVVHELGPLPADEAAELFVHCVRKRRMDWSPTSSEAPHVAGIVAALDGNPLAIQLAAPRMVVMSARALLHRLHTGLEALSRGEPGRHSTLQAAIEASWNALEPWEQRVLCQCTVFRGGFCSEAAEAVLDLRASAGAPPVLDALQSLREKSMLRAHKPDGVHDETRLQMYRAVREFASSKLDEAEARAIEARHADWFVDCAERWAEGRSGAPGTAQIDRENLLEIVERVAQRHPVTARTAEPALRALLALAAVAQLHGPMQSWIRVIEPTLEATKDSGADPLLVGRALALRGTLQRLRGDTRSASRDLVRAVGMARTLRAAGLEAEATLELAQIFANRGEGEQARTHHEAAIQLWRGVGALGHEARAMASLGSLLSREGRTPEAIALLERAVAAHEAHRNPIALALDHRLLAEVLIDVGRSVEARDHLASSIRLSVEVGDPAAAAIAAGTVGLLEHDAGQGAAAENAFDLAVAAMVDLGLPHHVGLFTGMLGVLRREQGRGAEASTLLRQALASFGTEGEGLHAAVALVHLAALDREARRNEDANASIERASNLAQSLNAPSITSLVGWQRALLSGEGVAQARNQVEGVASGSVHVRIALRCEERVGPRSVEPPPDDALVVAPGAKWFRAPHGECVSLERRRPLARLLDRLMQERLQRPGHALAWEEVLEAAWPNEKVIPAAGAHRVRVAVSTLRKLGLRDLLRTAEEGYVLSTECKTVQL